MERRIWQEFSVEFRIKYPLRMYFPGTQHTHQPHPAGSLKQSLASMLIKEQFDPFPIQWPFPWHEHLRSRRCMLYNQREASNNAKQRNAELTSLEPVVDDTDSDGVASLLRRKSECRRRRDFQTWLQLEAEIPMQANPPSSLKNFNSRVSNPSSGIQFIEYFRASR